jgi:inosine/xanthosine triphosphatase
MSELKIIVASTNPVKIEAARQGFAPMFPDAALDVGGVSVPSGVSDQPMTNAETLRGAYNRADNARTASPEADYWVGIEGGVEDMDGALMAFAWIVVLSHERSGRSRTATFILPDEVTRLVHEGLELGDADDRVFGRSNSKQQNGSVGILTGDVIDRTAFYAHAVAMALIPFVNPELTFPAVALRSGRG